MTQINPQLPNPNVRRRLIEQKRDNLRASAFDAEIEVESVKAQTVGVTEEERERTITELTAKAANCYASAARMDDMLKSLPKPPEKEG